MKNSSIKITSQGSGWQEKFTAECRVERGISPLETTIFYKNDGDECKLVLGENFVKMSRVGKTPLNMTFSGGRRTACSAGEGELCCELDCLTSFLEINRYAHGIRVKLKYTLSGSPVSLDAVIMYNL